MAAHDKLGWQQLTVQRQSHYCTASVFTAVTHHKLFVLRLAQCLLDKPGTQPARAYQQALLLLLLLQGLQGQLAESQQACQTAAELPRMPPQTLGQQGT
jgi:hypothetical protein